MNDLTQYALAHLACPLDTAEGRLVELNTSNSQGQPHTAPRVFITATLNDGFVVVNPHPFIGHCHFFEDSFVWETGQKKAEKFIDTVIKVRGFLDLTKWLPIEDFYNEEYS